MSKTSLVEDQRRKALRSHRRSIEREVADCPLRFLALYAIGGVLLFIAWVLTMHSFNLKPGIASFAALCIGYLLLGYVAYELLRKVVPIWESVKLRDGPE